jgi:hypothetical protein
VGARRMGHSISEVVQQFNILQSTVSCVYHRPMFTYGSIVVVLVPSDGWALTFPIPPPTPTSYVAEYVLYSGFSRDLPPPFPPAVLVYFANLVRTPGVRTLLSGLPAVIEVGGNSVLKAHSKFCFGLLLQPSGAVTALQKRDKCWVFS